MWAPSLNSFYDNNVDVVCSDRFIYNYVTKKQPTVNSVHTHTHTHTKYVPLKHVYETFKYPTYLPDTSMKARPVGGAVNPIT